MSLDVRGCKRPLKRLQFVPESIWRSSVLTIQCKEALEETRLIVARKTDDAATQIGAKERFNFLSRKYLMA